MTDLASVLDSKGKYEEAQEIYRQGLAMKETLLGKEHPDALTSFYYLSYSLHQKKRYKDAEGSTRLTKEARSLFKN